MFKKVFLLSVFVLNLYANDNTDTTYESVSHNGFSYNVITSPITGRQWLDRNLGATEACTQSRDSFSTDVEYIASQEACFGDYYQWGRLSDGHEKKDSGITDVLTTDISNAGIDFIHSYTSYDWAKNGIDDNGTLRAIQWSKIDGTSICPIGFRVPSEDELFEETILYKGIDNEITGAIKVTNTKTAFKNFLKFPFSGLRNSYDGNPFINYRTYIWTNSLLHYGSNASGILTFTEDYISDSAVSWTTGATVRCIKDYNSPNPELGNWVEPRDSSTITKETNGNIKSTADGTDTFGIIREITSLIIGKKYTLKYSFLTKNSTNSFGRISNDIRGKNTIYNLFHHTNSDKEGTFTFTATSTKMYVAFLSTTDNAHIEIEYANLSINEENNDTWTEPRDSSTITKEINGNIKSTADGTDTFGIIKKLPDLEVGKEYKLFYSFLTGTSTNSFGRISKDSQGKDISYSLFHNIDKDKEATFTFTATQKTMYIAFLSTTDNANIEVEYADISISEDSSDTWTEPRNSSTITTVDSNTRSTADGTDTFGMVKKLTDLVVGEEYKLSYSFLTGTSTNSFGRISEDREGITITYNLFHHKKEDKKETFTFVATKTTMYIAFLSTTDNAYIEVEYANLEEKDIPTTVSHDGFTYNVVTSPYTGRKWLDRNLGATEVCTESIDSFSNNNEEYFESQKNCFGDYYQWGRLTDGHEKIDSGNTDVLATDISNAGVDFIVGDLRNKDWTETDEIGNLRKIQWSKTDGTSVCPIGFRVPTIDELNIETEGVLNYDHINKNFLKIPLSSGRISYYFVDEPGLGAYGGLWSSSVKIHVIGYYESLSLRSHKSNTENSADSRNIGLPIRCIKN